MKEITMQAVPLAGSSSPVPGGGKKVEQTGFSEMLRSSMETVNGQMQEADQLVTGLAAGQHANIHETMIAMEKAGISFRLMTRVQQKVIDAYREVMRMQL
ncbi:flagellar hook-basal body complex protein FliE [Thiovibrio sp. JS02]